MDRTLQKVDEIVAELIRTWGNDRIDIVNVFVPNSNNFFICYQNLLTSRNSGHYTIDMYHSDDGFVTNQDYGMSADGSGATFFNRNGYAHFSTNKKEDKVYLSLIEISEKFYGRGYGSLLFNYLKSLVRENELVNEGHVFTHLEGEFMPIGRDEESVRNFYIRHGANVMMLDHREKVRICLLDKSSQKN